MRGEHQSAKLRQRPLVLFACALALWAGFAAGVERLRAQQPASNPKLVEHVRAGLKAREENRLDDAARELEAAAKLAPNVAEVHLNLGLVYHRQHRLEAAAGAFEKALELKPELPGVRDLLGLDLLMLGQVEPAVRNLEAAYSENPSGKDVNFWLGLAYSEIGNFRSAIPKLEFARKNDPQNVDVLFYLSRAYQKVAAEVQDELLRIAPDSPRAHLAAAEDHAVNGRSAAALGEYQQVAELAPEMPGIQAAIAELQANDGNYAEAEESYREELALNPNNARVNYRYGIILQQLGRTADSVPHLQRAVAGDPSIVDAYAQLGKALLASGDMAGAEKALLHVLTMTAAPETLQTTHYQLGQLYRKQGNSAAAAKHLQKFSELRAAEKAAN